MGARILRISSTTGLGKYRDSCAAILAGLTAARGMSDFELFFRGDEEPRPISGCVAPIVTHGFSGIGRFVALLHCTLIDLLCDPVSRDLLAAPWFVALPDPRSRNIDAGLDRVDDPSGRVEWLGCTVIERAFAAAGVRGGLQRCRFYSGDRVAFPAALDDAISGLRTGAYQRCVVGAVDSLLSMQVLEALARDNLLRTPKNEYGLVPGEAAALIVLDSGGDGGGGSTPNVEAVVTKPKTLNAERGDGRALATAILEASDAATATRVEAGIAAITDQNGERERAYEWGDALVYLAAHHFPTTIRPTLHHAMSLGDTGVCASALGLTLAAYMMSRGRLLTPAVLTASSFEAPLCAATLLTGA